MCLKFKGFAMNKGNYRPHRGLRDRFSTPNNAVRKGEFLALVVGIDKEYLTLIIRNT